MMSWLRLYCGQNYFKKRKVFSTKIIDYLCKKSIKLECDLFLGGNHDVKTGIFHAKPNMGENEWWLHIMPKMLKALGSINSYMEYAVHSLTGIRLKLRLVLRCIKIYDIMLYFTFWCILIGLIDREKKNIWNA